MFSALGMVQNQSVALEEKYSVNQLPGEGGVATLKQSSGLDAPDHLEGEVGSEGGTVHCLLRLPRLLADGTPLPCGGGGSWPDGVSAHGMEQGGGVGWCGDGGG